MAGGCADRMMSSPAALQVASLQAHVPLAGVDDDRRKGIQLSGTGVWMR